MKKIKVYWAPFIDNSDKNMNLIYEDPQSLYSTLNKKRNKKTQREASMFACPVVNQSYQNIFVFKNPIKSFYQFKTTGMMLHNLELIKMNHFFIQTLLQIIR